MDAVRVMTIHGSKGLEFRRCAFARRLRPAIMPSDPAGRTVARRRPRCRSSRMQTGDHDAEEECLFFVALSRARDYPVAQPRRALHGRRTPRHRSSCHPSSGRAVQQRHSETAGAAARGADRARAAGARATATTERELDALYANARRDTDTKSSTACAAAATRPPMFGFTAASTAPSAGWKPSAQGRAVDASRCAPRALHAEWAEGRTGQDHGLRSLLPRAAEGMVSAMVPSITHETGTYDREEWTVDVGGTNVTVTPDRVVLGPDGIGARATHPHRARRPSRSLTNRSMRCSGAARWRGIPGGASDVETFYLATGEARACRTRNDDKLLAEISRTPSPRSERGQFPPEPDARTLPQLPVLLHLRRLTRRFRFFPRSHRFLLEGPTIGPRKER